MSEKEIQKLFDLLMKNPLPDIKLSKEGKRKLRWARKESNKLNKFLYGRKDYP